MEETGMPRSRWSGAVRYGLPGLLLGLALASGGRGGGRELWAQVPAPSPVSAPASAPMAMSAGGGSERGRGVAAGGEADGTIAFATSPNNGNGPVQLLYLID